MVIITFYEKLIFFLHTCNWKIYEVKIGYIIAVFLAGHLIRYSFVHFHLIGKYPLSRLELYIAVIHQGKFQVAFVYLARNNIFKLGLFLLQASCYVSNLFSIQLLTFSRVCS